MSYCIPFNDENCHGDAVTLVGGKNASLGELTAAGVRVPPGFAVTTEFYEQFLKTADLDQTIQDRLNENDLKGAETAKAAGQDIREAIRSRPFPPELEAELETAWNDLCETCNSDDLGVAVRSSATAEDLPDASFAGQQDTYLNVSGIDYVKRRVRDCMASLFTARAISYREENDFDHDAVLISVGVQKMVDSLSSGVMFTVNPANGDRSKVRIESNWGLGESVVSGEVTPDSFLVDKPVGSVVKRDVSTKRVMTEKTDSGAKTVDVPEEKRDEASVSQSEIEELTERAKKIEKHYGQPQDIEWAIEEDTDSETIVYILQSRPETTWNEEVSDADETDSRRQSSTDKSTSTSTVDQMIDVLSGGDS